MPKRILVVDDEAVIRSLFKRVLEMKGYRVVTVEEGALALDKIKEEPFDAVFLDIVMPGIDGLKTCQTMKAINPELKIIIMTGYGKQVEEKIEKALRVGAYACLYKPFSIKKLLDTLEEALKR